MKRLFLLHKMPYRNYRHRRVNKNMPYNKTKVGIIGGRSVVAGELLRLLLAHNNVEITYVESSSKPDTPVGSEHPFLQGKVSLDFSQFDCDFIANNCDLVFVSRPHMQSATVIEQLHREQIKIIDMGADFRLQDPGLYPAWYNVEHPCPSIISEFTYGLSEINKAQIASSKRVANPGCYPTSVILGCFPILKVDGWDFSRIIVDSYSGVSGAGKKASDKNHFLNNYGNVIPYRFGEHPHTAEMEQALCWGSKSTKILFFPHVLPIERGIISTVFIPLPPGNKSTQKELTELYQNFYRKDVFVRVQEGYPEIKNVAHTNFCNIGLKIDERTGYLAITSVIDNIMKGAAGQGVQNMNIMEGYPEKEGL